MIANSPHLKNITKWYHVSDVGEMFDVLGWFVPIIIKVKLLLQRLWEWRVDWDDLVPEPIHDKWFKWHSELDLLPTKCIPRCYFNKSTQIASLQLHEISDASENAYAAVVYSQLQHLCKVQSQPSLQTTPCSILLNLDLDIVYISTHAHKRMQCAI